MMAGARKFKLIEHTADTGIVAYGDSLPGAFANAAAGMFSIITDLRYIREAESRTISVNEPDAESLLFEWLNSLIYLFDVEGLLFRRCDVRQFSDTKLVAVCHGEKYDPSRHHLKIGIKSATYHMLKVDKGNNQVQVIFDI